MFSLVFRTRMLHKARTVAVRIRRRAGGVSSASHLPREHWLTVHRGPEVLEFLVREARQKLQEIKETRIRV